MFCNMTRTHTHTHTHTHKLKNVSTDTDSLPLTINLMYADKRVRNFDDVVHNVDDVVNNRWKGLDDSAPIGINVCTFLGSVGVSG